MCDCLGIDVERVWNILEKDLPTLKTGAIEVYRKALENVHDFSELNYNLAFLLQQQGNLPEAIKQLEAGLEIDPNSAKIRQFLDGLRRW